MTSNQFTILIHPHIHREKVLNLPRLRESILYRIIDMKKNIDGASQTLATLRVMTDYITEQESHRMLQSISSNTKALEDVMKASERSSIGIEMVEYILAGGVAFDVIDTFKPDVPDETVIPW